MREGQLEMSQKERDRLKVVEGLQQGHLNQAEAARRLGLSTRQVQRLLQRVRREGDRGIMHRLRGRPSNRKISAARRERILAELRSRYQGFGPTLASEHLARQKLLVSRETLRKIMMTAGLWKPRRQRVEAVHVWRERRAAFGELVMMDSSPYRWLEQRGPVLQLIAMIDDATSRFWGRFTEHDSTEENLRTVGDWLRRYGRPIEMYTDKNSIFHTTRPVQWSEQLEAKPARTQFERALDELGIRPILAHSPQAKGRIERLFGTLQDRLVKEMRLAGVNTTDQANRFLQEVFLPSWEQRFTVAARNSRDSHRPLRREHRLPEILSVREPRSVANDYTVRWQGQRWAVARQDVQPGLRGARVELERRLDGGMWLRFRNHYLPLSPCPGPPLAATPSGLRPPGLAAKLKRKLKPKHIPPPNHPWRNTTFLFGRKYDISTLR
jgi:transposase